IRPLSPLIVRLFGKTQKYPITFSGPTYLYVFDRKTEAWTFVGDMKGGRRYPTNTLLPDGRVLSSGTTPLGKHELGIEVYSPAYLFRVPAR
ncbi:MAG TPA: hypothetical protein VF646_18730, partial [Cytophagales bacterium]